MLPVQQLGLFFSGWMSTTTKDQIFGKVSEKLRLLHSPSAQLWWSTFLNPVGHAHVYVLLLGRQRWLQPPLLPPQRFLPPAGEQ